MTTPRNSRIDWASHHMLLALVTSRRSPDPSTQVGACIVDKKNRVVLSLGYNGPPRGLPTNRMPWNREAEKQEDTKYLYVMHAEANAILGSLGLTEEDLPYYVQSKRKAVERVIAENSAEGTFPILGYSYYQYANSLEAKEPASALLYLEYALEMSDLSIYFPEQKKILDGFMQWRISKEWIAFGEGILVGVGMVVFLWWMKPYLWKKGKKRKSYTKSNKYSN